MATCEKCLRNVPQLFDVRLVDEDELERERENSMMYYMVLGLYYEPETPYMSVHMCLNCFVGLTGKAPPPNQILPIENTFTTRTLQSNIATALVKALFEHCGYEVRHSGYEHTTPEWTSSLKRGDANIAARRIRASPDLRVYDRSFNSLYDIEVKTTRQPSNRWRYRSDLIDTLRYYHEEAILMVYVQHEHEFYVQTLNKVDWKNMPIYGQNSSRYYEVDLVTSFLKPHQCFDGITPKHYYPFIEGARIVIAEFA